MLRLAERLRPPAFSWLVRPRRVLLLLGAIWLLNAFDLAYTLGESERRTFREMNPLAAQLVKAPPAHLITYKSALVAVGSGLLLALRRERVAELACWFVLAVYCAVAIRWWIYFEHMLEAVVDPAVNVHYFVH